jgi:hypothetical protein
MSEQKQIPSADYRDLKGRLSRTGICARLDEGPQQLKRIRGLPSQVEAQDICYAVAHNSTAIEENTLVLKSVDGPPAVQASLF